MIITKQRMSGYTPLRQRDTDTHVVVQPARVEPTPQPATPVETVSPAPIVDPTPSPETRLEYPMATRQRMAGYVPLRRRNGAPAPSLQAQPGNHVAVAETPPVPVQDVVETPVSELTTEHVPSTSTLPAPQNRMQGYTPLRQRDGGTPVLEPELETQTEPVVVTATVTPAPTVTPTQAGVDKQDTDVERPRWLRPALMVGGAVIVALLMVFAARALRSLEPVQAFITTYDGHSTMPSSAPTGMPWWMGWQHFLNMFFMVLIIRTGLQIRHERRPEAMWTPRAGSVYSPGNNTPKKVSITTWVHQTLDVLWVLNGLVFVILLAITGHWMRVVPTSWDIFPNMASVALQYASFDWPTENGWIHYNALQMISYFLIIYVAAPLAVLTGLRMSSWWPTQATRLNRIFPVELARALHFPVMIFFVLFILTHVFLVFTTGALRNLNHMYTSRDVADIWGLVVFAASVAITALAWVLLRPTMLIPLASRVGTVSKN